MNSFSLFSFFLFLFWLRLRWLLGFGFFFFFQNLVHEYSVYITHPSSSPPPICSHDPLHTPDFLFFITVTCMHTFYTYTHTHHTPHSLLRSFSVAYMNMCLGFTTWDQVSYQEAHAQGSPFLPLSAAIDCCSSSPKGKAL